MTNVETKVEGDKLTITVDLSKTVGRSKSGKSVIIATTSGSVTVDTKRGPVKVGLNVYTLEG
jgi:hypothetical protein